MIGGFTAVAYTDAIQVIIMIGGSAIMVLIGLDKVGGWDGLMTKVPEMMTISKPYDDPVKFKQGKDAMITIAIGLIIIYLAWFIVSSFIEFLGGKDWTLQFFKK
jgi:Na+/pantothenate symporter